MTESLLALTFLLIAYPNRMTSPYSSFESNSKSKYATVMSCISYGSWGEGFHHGHVVFQNTHDPLGQRFQSVIGA